MRTIDWNKASELGLIQRINSEILHPLGLAMTRTVDTGISSSILVADDAFTYSDSTTIKPVLTVDEIRELLNT